jgi:hypothetical protein
MRLSSPPLNVVVTVQSGFHGYLVADSSMDYDLLEWFGEYSPSVGAVILDELNNFSRTYLIAG